MLPCNSLDGLGSVLSLSGILRPRRLLGFADATDGLADEPAAQFKSSQREAQRMRLLLLGLAVAVVVYVATGGHVLFLPLLLILPFGWLFGGRHRSTSLLRPRRRRRSLW